MACALLRRRALKAYILSKSALLFQYVLRKNLYLRREREYRHAEFQEQFTFILLSSLVRNQLLNQLYSKLHGECSQEKSTVYLTVLAPIQKRPGLVAGTQGVNVSIRSPLAWSNLKLHLAMSVSGAKRKLVPLMAAPSIIL